MDRSRANNPLFGPNKFKLGVFSANCDGGLTMSLAPERWRANWDDIVAMTRIADAAGLEFILPVAKWRGFQGKANIYGRSFETLTHGAALGAVTRRIAIFSTVHVPLVTPAFGAKAIATIDQARRYDHGLEWFRIWSRLLQGGPEFDWDGEFFHLRRLQTDPVSVQRPWPAVMSAGFSPKGRDFAAQTADVLFTTMSELDQAPDLLADVHSHVARHNRRVDIYTMSHVVCRPTRREADDFYHYFAEEMADADGQAYYRRQRGSVVKDDAGNEIRRPLVNRFMRASGKRYDGAYPGTFPLVGTPDDIVADMSQMSELGLAGTSVAFLDYLKEIPFFVQEVVPRLERLDLRLAV